MRIKTINPANGQELKSYQTMDESIVNTILEKSYQAQQQWSNFSITDRVQLFLKLAELLEKNKSIYSNLITTEMGNPITQAISEIEKCAWACRHYAEHTEQYLQPKEIKTDFTKSYISYQPWG